MTVNPPKFIDSEYLIVDEKGWRLSQGAPKELVKEFEDFMESLTLNET